MQKPHQLRLRDKLLQLIAPQLLVPLMDHRLKLFAQVLTNFFKRASFHGIAFDPIADSGPSTPAAVYELTAK